MKILVVMLHWYPYEGPLMPIYGTIFRELTRRGHEITIVTSFPHYRKGRTETWDEYRGKVFEIGEWEGVRLIRCYVFAPVFGKRSPGLVYRALNFLSFNVSSLLSAVFTAGKADIVFAPSSPPLTNGIICWLVSLFKLCPVVYNVQDLYPDMAVKMGLTGNGILLSLLRTLEKLVYRVSMRILTISSTMKTIISKKGVAPEKIEVIENFIDTQFIRPESQDNMLSRSHGLAGKFVVMYAGNIGIPHGVESLVEAAEILKGESGIVFCFVARGEKKEDIVLLTKSKMLTNVLFISYQPEHLVPFIWASASVGVVTYRRGLADFSVPSKLLAMMCAARPVIAAVDEESAQASLISRSKCGIVVPPENGEKMAKAILRLKNDPDECLKLGLNGRRYAEMTFGRKIVVDRYEALFNLLIGKPAQTQKCNKNSAAILKPEDHLVS